MESEHGLDPTRDRIMSSKRGWRLLGALAFLGGLASTMSFVWACGSRPQNTFETPEASGTTGPDAEDPPTGDPPIFPDGSNDVRTCESLECKRVDCGNGNTTSVSGTVYDPSGTTPLYNVAVYIPNAPLAPIADGIDLTKCVACSAPLSGNPLTVALTDSHGHFKLDNVPVGSTIPIVLQTGKFRREGLTIPNVVQCQDNPFADPLHQILRLPKNQKEGHLPLVAITTGGCEGLECVIRAYGFDDAEFTSGTGTGRFHLYSGLGGGGAVGTTDAYTFWGSNDIYKYDMIVNSCECSPHPRDSSGPAYTNMQKYLDHGGRLFTSDFQYNWFTDPQAPTPFKTTANWITNQGAAKYGAPWFVDTSFPKGKALDDWLQYVFKANDPPPPGQITLVALLYNVAEVKAPATRWIYATADGTSHLNDKNYTSYTTKYLSFNTPVSSDADAGAEQCGRAVFADLHLSHNVHSSQWPTGCDALAKDQQVTAFEFLFFDIASCVQNDQAVPQPPQPN